MERAEAMGSVLAIFVLFFVTQNRRFEDQIEAFPLSNLGTYVWQDMFSFRILIPPRFRTVEYFIKFNNSDTVSP